MESDNPEKYRPPLDQYLALLVLCAEGVLIHSLNEDDETAKPDINRINGCHRFCSELFSRFAETVAVCNNVAYRKLADEARQLARKVINQ